MRYHWLSVLSVLTIAPLPGLTTRLAPPWDDIRVKHAWNAVPANWESLGPPPPGTTIDLHVALKPHNENALIDALYEVSSPGHPKYGAHLSKDEVAELVAPHPDTLKLIHSWLVHHDIPSSSISTTHGGGWLTLTSVPVSQANRLLGASYELYRHAGTNDSTILRTIGYALPTVLHTHVQTVAPTTLFASLHAPRQTPHRPSVGATEALSKTGPREPATVMSSRDEPQAVTPEILRWLYRTSTYVPGATGQNALGIAGYMNEYASPIDLARFMYRFRADAEGATFTVEQVNDGEYDPSHPDLQANVNIQYAQAIAYPTPHIYYSTAGPMRWGRDSGQAAPGDMLIAWLNHVLGQPNIPQTISTSYGLEEKFVPLEYARTVCNLFAQLGARGVSVLFTTGDDGVGLEDCWANDGSGEARFSPWFPATCPWVTSVGGTKRRLPEVAASLSGGGFSNHFPRPKYQNDAVPTFLQDLGDRYDGMYNATGRGIPDIAAQALYYKVIVDSNPYFASGTSCAAPTVAGIISLLNDFLLMNGKPPLGFLNPWLYGRGLAGLNDITSGSNPGCSTEGFSAIAGWDPVTGLGTPDFVSLRDHLFM